MSKKFMMNSIISALGVFAASSAIAATEQIECPSTKFVSGKSVMLDTIHILPKQSYLVYSDADPVYDPQSKRNWSITTMVGAPDLNEAFIIANENVNAVNVQWDKYAKMYDAYYCKYTGTDVSRVVYLVTQAEGRGNRLAAALKMVK